MELFTQLIACLCTLTKVKQLLLLLQVQTIIRSRTTVGQRHRDHANTGNVIKPDVNGALSKYFFGENLDQKLSYEKFIDFHKDIHDEVLWIEVSFNILLWTELQFIKTYHLLFNFFKT